MRAPRNVNACTCSRSQCPHPPSAPSPARREREKRGATVAPFRRMSDKKTEFEGKRVFVFTRDGWEFVERKSAKEAVAVIATTDDGKLVLTEQYRRPVDRRVIDVPAGLIGDEGDTND